VGTPDLLREPPHSRLNEGVAAVRRLVDRWSGNPAHRSALRTTTIKRRLKKSAS